MHFTPYDIQHILHAAHQADQAVHLLAKATHRWEDIAFLIPRGLAIFRWVRKWSAARSEDPHAGGRDGGTVRSRCRLDALAREPLEAAVLVPARELRDQAAAEERRMAGGARTKKTAEELLKRFAAGERHFGVLNLSGADLSQAHLSGPNFARVNLSGADLGGAYLSQAHLRGANLAGANLARVDLSGANLAGVNLSGADLSGADLREVNFVRADLSGADLGGADFFESVLNAANLDGVGLGFTTFNQTDLTAFCTARETLSHHGSSSVDHFSIARSLHAPGLMEFLVDTGMPHVVATYTIDALRSLNETDLFQMLHSTFISYGGPDEAFAKRLNEALSLNGVKTVGI